MRLVGTGHSPSVQDLGLTGKRQKVFGVCIFFCIFAFLNKYRRGDVACRVSTGK